MCHNSLRPESAGRAHGAPVDPYSWILGDGMRCLNGKGGEKEGKEGGWERNERGNGKGMKKEREREGREGDGGLCSSKNSFKMP